MESNRILLLLVALLVKTCSGFDAVQLCPDDLCTCESPQAPEECSFAFFEDMSYFVQLETESCMCLCGHARLQPCLKDADCVAGFSCTVSPPGMAHISEKVCTCPCDGGSSDPFCPMPLFSTCLMTGPDASCKTRKDYKCTQKLVAPVCVLWEDQTVYEYRNPCYFVNVAAPLSKNDPRYKRIGKHCDAVPEFHGEIFDVYDYEGKKKYLLNIPPTTLLGYDFDAMSNSHKFTHGGFFRPEPEPEGEPII